MEELLAEGLIGWLFILGVIVSSVLLLHYYLSKRRYYQLARKIPAPTGLPIIGHALMFLKGSEEAFRNVWNTMDNYDVCKLWLGSRLLVFIRNPADIELVLESRTHICKSIESGHIESRLGDGINIVSGCKWSAYRQMIAPMFQLSTIKSFEPTFNNNSRILENKLLKSVGKDVYCYNYISDAMMKVLLESILGVKENTEASKKYSQAIQKLSKIIRYRQTSVSLFPDIIFNFTKYAKLQEELMRIVHRFTRQAVKNRKELLTKLGHRLPKNDIFEDINANIHNNNNATVCWKEDNGRLSLLDIMIELSQNDAILMDSEIQSQVEALILEGHDTTVLTSSYFLCVMADRPDIQDKCAAELNEIFGNLDRPVTFEDTLKMKYLERCLMETLRIYPPIPMIARKLQEELRLVSTPITIPASSTVMIDLKQLHKNEDIYSTPDIFNPDNFLLENCALRHYYSYIPFSAGPSSCIGMKYSMFSLKVLLASVLRKFKILPRMGQETATSKPDDFVIRLELRKQ